MSTYCLQKITINVVTVSNMFQNWKPFDVITIYRTTWLHTFPWYPTAAAGTCVILSGPE